MTVRGYIVYCEVKAATYGEDTGEIVIKYDNVHPNLAPHDLIGCQMTVRLTGGSDGKSDSPPPKRTEHHPRIVGDDDVVRIVREHCREYYECPECGHTVWHEQDGPNCQQLCHTCCKRIEWVEPEPAEAEPDMQELSRIAFGTGEPRKSRLICWNCGSDEVEESDCVMGMKARYQVYCEHCGVNSPLVDTPDEADQWWRDMYYTLIEPVNKTEWQQAQQRIAELEELMDYIEYQPIDEEEADEKEN